MLGHQTANNGVTRLVISRVQLLFLAHHHGATFRAHEDLVLGFLELLHGHHALVGTGSKQRRFVDQIGKICTGETGGAAGNHAGIHVFRDWHLAHMNLEYVLATTDIRQWHSYLAVETTRAQQRRIQHVGAVGGSDDDDAFIAIKPVHFHQQLVQGLFTLIVAATDTGATGTAHRINLIDEDDAGRMLFGLLKHVTDTAGTNTHKHFHKVRAGNAEERHLGLPRNGLGQQGFTRTGRTDHQHAAGNLAAQALEFRRITQKLDQLLHFFLGFFHPCHIGKGGLDLVFAEQLGLGLAEGHRPAAAFTTTLHLAHEEDEDRQNNQDRQYRQEQLHQEALTLGLHTYHIHLVLDQRRHQVGIQCRRFHRLELAAILVGASDRAFADLGFLHVTTLHPRNKIRVGDTG